MKRLLILFTVLVGLASCSDPIDKNISKETFNQDVKAIEEKYADQYTPADFEKFRGNAANKITAQFMGFNKNEAVTYREILDSAKAQRIRVEAEMKAFNVAIDKMKATVAVTVDSGIYAADYGGIEAYLLGLTIKNTSAQAVSAMEGQIFMFDPLGKKIHTHYVKYLQPLAAGAAEQDARPSILFDGDDYEALKTLAFNQIKFDWQPDQIVFTDGSKMVAPPKPIMLK